MEIYINFLRVGRHFRFSPDTKIIVGRDREDNAVIQSLTAPDNHTLHVKGFGSPVTVISGNATDESIDFAASLCARYSDARKLPEVEVTVSRNDQNYLLKVQPAKDEIIGQYRIEKNNKSLALK